LRREISSQQKRILQNNKTSFKTQQIPPSEQTYDLHSFPATADSLKKARETSYKTSRLCMYVMVFRVVTRCSLEGVINLEYGNLYFHLCENLKSHIA